MPRASVSTGIELEYDTIGSPDDPTVLLVMGLGAQLIAWSDGFCKMLAADGLFVIRFDNRDVGLSSSVQPTVEAWCVDRQPWVTFPGMAASLERE